MSYTLGSKSLRLIRTLDEAVTIMKPVAVEDDLEKRFTEWQELKRQLSILNLVAEKIGSRLTELETDLKSITKASANQQVMIDEAIVQYKTRNNTSTSYATLFEKALEISTDDQKKILMDLKDAITKKSVSESLKIVDPKLEGYLDHLKYMDPKDLVDKLQDIKKIPDSAPVAPKQESIMDYVKALLDSAKAAFKKVFASVVKGQKSASALLALSKKP